MARQAGVLIPKDIFQAALDAFNDHLAELNTRMTFYCVGGGMLMFTLGARDKTEDLDGMVGPNSPGGMSLFQEIADRVSKEFIESGRFNLLPGWINNQVEPILRAQGFKPSWFEAHPGLSWSHLTVLFGNPGLILSMKVQAMRLGKQDFKDMVKLVQHLNIRTLDNLEAEVDKYGAGWAFVAHEEWEDLKLMLAWAFPGETEYDRIRIDKIEEYRRIKRGR